MDIEFIPDLATVDLKKVTDRKPPEPCYICGKNNVDGYLFMVYIKKVDSTEVEERMYMFNTWLCEKCYIKRYENDY